MKNISLISGICISLLLLVLYIVQLNSLTALAWSIGDAERQISELKRQNAPLQTNVYHIIPLADLEELARQRNFEKVTSITYLKVSDGLVAQNQTQ